MNNFSQIIKRQKGLNLIELMIAMVLGLMLTAVVLQFYLSNKATSQTQTGMSEMQENARFVLNMMSEDIQKAGYTGCGSNAQMSEMPGKEGLSDALKEQNKNITSWLKDNTNVTHNFLLGIGGFEAVGTSHDDSAPFALSKNGSVATITDFESNTDAKLPLSNSLFTVGGSVKLAKGSDVLLITGMDPSNTVYLGNPPFIEQSTGAGSFDKFFQAREKLSADVVDRLKDAVVMVSDCTQAASFQVSMITNDTPTRIKGESKGNNPGNAESARGQGPRNRPWGFGTKISVGQRYIYFIGLTADGPTLMRSSLTNAGVSSPVPLMVGVESLQVRFGVANQGVHDNLIPGAVGNSGGYYDANNVPSFEDVVAVEIALLVRSQDGTIEADDTEQYQIFSTPFDPDNGRYLRRVYTQTATLRNRKI